jgi:hypothetical protein
MANEGLTAQEIFEYTGVKAENLEEFKTAFDSKFLTRENAANDDEIRSKLTGRVTGSITTHLKRQAKDAFGVEVSKDEIEGKKVEEIIDLVTGRAKETYEAQISELSEKVAKSPKVEEVAKEWEDKYNKVVAEKSNFESLLNQTKQEFEAKENEWLTKQKTSTIDAKKEGLMGSLSFSKQVDDLKKIGFDTYMNKTYALDLSDDGKLQIKKDGNLIPNPSKHGEFMNPKDVFEMEAKEKGLLAAPNTEKNSNFVSKPAAVNTDGLPNNRPSRATANRAF